MFSKGNKSSTGPAQAGSGTSSAAKAAPSIISADLKITGNLASEGDLQIDGTVEGDITCRTATVGEGALVQGSILANTVRIYGTVSGEIKANDVILAKSARVDGDIGHASIAMEAGASVSGRLSRIEKPVVAVEKKAADKPAGSGATAPSSGGGTGSSQNYSGYRA